MSRLLLPAVLAVAMLTGACGSPTTTPTPPAASPTASRVAAITAARTALGPVASALGTAAVTLGDRVDQAAGEPAPAVVSAVRDAVARLGAAVADVHSADVPDTDVADVAAAVEALDRGASAGRAAAEAAGRVAGLLEELRAIDDRLAALVDTWDAPGSHSQKMDLLQQTQDDATALTAELTDRSGALPRCRDPFQVRAAAAQTVVDVTAELRGYVVRRQGTTFDERIAELAGDPYGLGEALATAGAVDAQNCDVVGAVGAAVADVTAALADVQAALNPTDLEG